MVRLFLIALAFPLFLLAQTVGTTIAVFGVVKVDRSGRQYDLERGSNLYVKDRIRVETESYAKLRFTDGSIVSLSPETDYNVDDYKFSETGTHNSFISELIAGGMRCISGHIAETNPDEYQVKTPTATLGIRGTIFRVRVTPEGGIIVGCDSGAVQIVNAAGENEVGPTVGARFAIVTSSDSAASLLSYQPEGFSQSSFLPPGCH